MLINFLKRELPKLFYKLDTDFWSKVKEEYTLCEDSPFVFNDYFMCDRSKTFEKAWNNPWIKDELISLGIRFLKTEPENCHIFNPEKSNRYILFQKDRVFSYTDHRNICFKIRKDFIEWNLKRLG